jgi:hypothetical protein
VIAGTGDGAVRADLLKRALEGFIPSAENAEKRMQELASILECTEVEMLPEAIREKLRDPQAKAELLRTFERLRGEIDG